MTVPGGDGGPRTPGRGPEPGRRRLSHRTALEERFGDLATRRGASGGALLDRLIGREQLWWKCCQEAVREDPGWLFQSQAERWRSWINKNAPDDGPAGRNPADPAYLVARALGCPFSPCREHLEALRPAAEAWDESRLLPSGPPLGDFALPGRAVPGAPERVALRLGSLLDTASGPAQVMVGLTALLLAGAERRKRPVVRVSVVFDRADHGDTGQEDGTAGVLELREFPAGPVGLFPDPQAMAGASSGGHSFAASLSHAWQASPWVDKGRCVLWRIVLSDRPSPALRISGGSLGAAFALGLRELFRHPVSRRPSVAGLRGVVYGLRPTTAVTGRLDEGARLRHVSGLGAKLQVARRKRWRLIAPEENRADISHPPATVKFATTLRQADRYARQWRTGRLVTAAAVLAVATTTGMVVSKVQADATARRHTAAKLADVATTLLNSDAGLAQLFAAQAYHHDPTPQTRAALFQAVSASPHLVRSLQAGGAISATAASGDGQTVAAGTKDGNVVMWRLSSDLKKAEKKRTVKLHGAVRMIATDTDGGTGAAIDDRTVLIWSATRPVASLGLPAGHPPTAVAVSPSGRFVAVSTEDEENLTSGLSLLDLTSGRTRHVPLKDMGSTPERVSFADDGHIVLLDGAYGTWVRLSTPELKRIAGSTIGFGIHNWASALSADGRYVTYTNADTWLPLWRTSGSPDLDAFGLVAETRGANPVALALSADGSRAAQAANTMIYVSRSTPPKEKREAPTVLTGAGPVTAGSVAFLGTDGDRLVSASGGMLTLWDLGQISRIGTASDALIPDSCNACPGPRIGLQPGGRHVVLVDGDGLTLDVQELGSGITNRQTERASPILQDVYSPPLWTADGTKIILVGTQDGSARIRALAPGLPTVGSWPAPVDPPHLNDPPTLLRLTPDGRRVVAVAGSGTVTIRDPTTGKILRRVPGPADMAPVSGGTSSLPQGYAAVDAGTAHAAVIDPDGGKVSVIDITTGHIRAIGGDEATGVAFVEDRLLIQRRDGTLEVWNSPGSTRVGTLRGLSDSVTGPVVNGAGTFAETDSEGTAKLFDYPSGYQLGTLPVPKGLKPNSIGLEFSADGKKLVTATEAAGLAGVGVVAEWQIDHDAWLRTACDSAGRDITAAQWRQYMSTSAPSDLRCPR
ncbi:WD40 repeat domain-containing protein [Sphaerisporangium perillae]|uniref:WD40 repeat domain-containing protein n=1 Tax=Sphaerisporangium perillae TaxID=2935860 RepID=UPI00200D21AD|nr:WD40 repeat domain-containing protein [Sphaerisporangium perillae]